MRAIDYQQLTAKAGDAMIDRLKDLAGPMFPAAAQIVAFDPRLLHACGLNAKVATIRAIAQGALDGAVPTRAAADRMGDEALVTQLISIKGAGRWTVQMLLTYSLPPTDVFPAGIFWRARGLSRIEVIARTATAGGTATTRLVAASDRGRLVLVADTALARPDAV